MSAYMDYNDNVRSVTNILEDVASISMARYEKKMNEAIESRTEDIFVNARETYTKTLKQDIDVLDSRMDEIGREIKTAQQSGNIEEIKKLQGELDAIMDRKSNLDESYENTISANKTCYSFENNTDLQKAIYDLNEKGIMAEVCVNNVTNQYFAITSENFKDAISGYLNEEKMEAKEYNPASATQSDMERMSERMSYDSASLFTDPYEQSIAQSEAGRSQQNIKMTIEGMSAVYDIMESYSTDEIRQMETDALFDTVQDIREADASFMDMWSMEHPNEEFSADNLNHLKQRDEFRDEFIYKKNNNNLTIDEFEKMWNEDPDHMFKFTGEGHDFFNKDHKFDRNNKNHIQAFENYKKQTKMGNLKGYRPGGKGMTNKEVYEMVDGIKKQYGIDLSAIKDKDELEQAVNSIKNKMIQNNPSLFGLQKRHMFFNGNRFDIKKCDLDKLVLDQSSPLSMAEKMFLKSTSGLGDKGLSGASGFFHILSRKMEQTGKFSFLRDSRRATERMKQIYRTKKALKSTLKSKVGLIDVFKVRKGGIDSSAKKVIGKGEGAIPNDLKGKQSQALRDKIHQFNTKHSEKQKAFRKALDKKTEGLKNNKIANKFKERQKKRVENKLKKHGGKTLLRKPFKAAKTIKTAVSGFIKKAIAFLLPKIALLILVVSILLSFIIMIVACITCIPSFLDKPKKEDTLVYHLVQDLNGKQAKWMENCADADDFLFVKKKFIKWGDSFQSYDDYINSGAVKNTQVTGGITYINSWGFKPADISALKVVTKFNDTQDGGEFNLEMMPGSTHTSNIKEIICMADTLFQFDMTNGTDMNLSMADSVISYNIKTTWNNLGVSLKRAGSVFGIGDYDENEDVMLSSYKDIRAYCYALFDASHQEHLYLESVILPVKPGDSDGCPESDKGGCASSNAFYWRNYGSWKSPDYHLTLDDENGGHHIVESRVTLNTLHNDCSPYYEYTHTDVYNNPFASEIMWQTRRANECWEYSSEYKTAPDDGIEVHEPGAVYVTEGETMKKYNYGDIETVAGSTYKIKKNDGYDSWDKTKLIAELKKRKLSTSNPTVLENAEYNKENGVLNELKVYRSRLRKYDAEKSGDDNKIYFPMSNSDNHSYTMGKNADTQTQKVFVETLTWHCKGHYGRFCGGHLKSQVSALSYTFTEAQEKKYQEKAKEGETNEFKDVVIEPKLKDVDYTSPETAKNSGLNLYLDDGGAWHYDVAFIPIKADRVKDGIDSCQDIFDVDMLIDYGSNIFPCQYNYRNFKSWDDDDMTIAMLKYGMDWNELYGFDVGAFVGTGMFTSEDLKSVLEEINNYTTTQNHVGMGMGLSSERQQCLANALNLVGRGRYVNPKSNPKTGPAGCIRCTTIPADRANPQYLLPDYDGSYDTDCSGFCSIVHILSGGDNVHSIGDTGSLREAGGNHKINSYDDIMPGDIVIHYDGGTVSAGGSSHALIYMGKLTQNVQLSNGYIIQAGYPFFCECTGIDPNGNIYLTGGCSGNITTARGCSGYRAAPDGKMYVCKFKNDY